MLIRPFILSILKTSGHVETMLVWLTESSKEHIVIYVFVVVYLIVKIYLGKTMML